MNDTQNTSESIIVGNCLNCQGLVRVPSKASAKSQVKCPHCSESFLLSQILDQAVPELEVMPEIKIEPIIPRVDQILTKSNEDGPTEKFVVPSQLSKGAKRARRRSGKGRSTATPSAELDANSDQAVGSQLSNSGAKRSDGRPRSSRRSRSKRQSLTQTGRGTQGIAEIIKIALGGLLAIPIAYLLVFWVFQKDPLNVGPGISEVIPFVVPVQFHGPNPDMEDVGSPSVSE